MVVGHGADAVTEAAREADPDVTVTEQAERRGTAHAVAQAGPAVAAFVANLTPLFTALMSAALLGEWPQPYHALAFVLIVAGIAVSTRR